MALLSAHCVATPYASLVGCAPNDAAASASGKCGYVSMASSGHFSGAKLKIRAAAIRSSSVRPSLFVIRAEDDSQGVADSVRTNADRKASDAGSFFKEAAEDVKRNVENASESVKQKAQEAGEQAQSVGQDFGIKANEATNRVSSSVEESGERAKEGVRSTAEG